MSAELDPIFDRSELTHDCATAHDARVEPDTFFTKDDGSRAVCSCGWKGPGRCYEQDAEADIRAHLREVEPEPLSARMSLPIALHYDPSPHAWRSYRARIGNDVRWYAFRQDAERWMEMMARWLQQPNAAVEAWHAYFSRKESRWAIR